jgi:hypothetical protein
MSNFFGKIKKWVKNFSKDVPVVGEVISFQDKAPYKERLKHLSGRAAAANKIPGAPDVIGLMKKSLDLSGVSLDNLSEVDRYWVRKQKVSTRVQKNGASFALT